MVLPLCFERACCVGIPFEGTKLLTDREAFTGGWGRGVGLEVCTWNNVPDQTVKPVQVGGVKVWGWRFVPGPVFLTDRQAFTGGWGRGVGLEVCTWNNVPDQTVKPVQVGGVKVWGWRFVPGPVFLTDRQAFTGGWGRGVGLEVCTWNSVADRPSSLYRWVG